MSDTRHFPRFPGSEEENPFFFWQKVKIGISRFFVKDDRFSARDTSTVFQKHRFYNPEL